MSNPKSVIWLTVFMLMVLGGCTQLAPFHTTKDPIRKEDGTTTPQNIVRKDNDCHRKGVYTCSLFVEYDDFGHLYSRDQLNDAEAAAEAVAKTGGVIVVYVHGWHRNAAPTDSDLTSFRRAIARADKLDRESYRSKKERKIMGVYVGWRGESVSMKPFNVLTFWDRKNTAHSIGDGAVYELFRKLANVREKHPTSKLVLIGHSFGAAVTYSSMAHSVMEQIIVDPDPAGPNSSPAVVRPRRWDMVVLINPAFEAMQVRPHFELARSRNYKPNQLPHLIIITSEADWATTKAFPIGRYFSTIFKAYADPVSSGMNTTAIGHYFPFVTHQLATSSRCLPGDKAISPERDKLGHVVDAPAYCFGDPRAMFIDEGTKEEPKPVLLTRCDRRGDCSEVAGDHYIMRGSAKDGKTPFNMPIMNIRTTSEVMNGHNDIWNGTMHSFLVQLLLLTVSQPESVPSIQ